jgi:hypothetical protein
MKGELHLLNAQGPVSEEHAVIPQGFSPSVKDMRPKKYHVANLCLPHPAAR